MSDSISGIFPIPSARAELPDPRRATHNDGGIYVRVSVHVSSASRLASDNRRKNTVFCLFLIEQATKMTINEGRRQKMVFFFLLLYPKLAETPRSHVRLRARVYYPRHCVLRVSDLAVLCPSAAGNNRPSTPIFVVPHLFYYARLLHELIQNKEYFSIYMICSFFLICSYIQYSFTRVTDNLTSTILYAEKNVDEPKKCIEFTM